MAEYNIKVNDTDTDVTELIATHPNFINKLDVSDFRSVYAGFPDVVYARKITALGWGTEYSNFPYKLIDGNGTNRTPKFLTKASCPYPKRPAINEKNDANNYAGGLWGDEDVYLSNYPVTISYSGTTLTININNSKKTVTVGSSLVFIDLCGGGGGGSTSNHQGAGGGGGGAASCFMAVDMATAKNITINVGDGGTSPKGGSGDAGGDGGDTTVIINDTEVIRLGGGKGGGAGKGVGEASGGDGGKCSGSLWNGSSYNTGYGILAITGFHGKAGASASDNNSGVEYVNQTVYGNQGGSFKPTSGSDVIPNFGIFEDFKIGYASDGTKNSELGLGGRSAISGGGGLTKASLGGGGGACAMGTGYNAGSYYSWGNGMNNPSGHDGRGANGVSTYKDDDGWQSRLASSYGHLAGDGNCIIHYKTDR